MCSKKRCLAPTGAPTNSPSPFPTSQPTENPTTGAPTESPTQSPTAGLTQSPTAEPTLSSNVNETAVDSEEDATSIDSSGKTSGGDSKTLVAAIGGGGAFVALALVLGFSIFIRGKGKNDDASKDYPDTDSLESSSECSSNGEIPSRKSSTIIDINSHAAAMTMMSNPMHGSKPMLAVNRYPSVEAILPTPAFKAHSKKKKQFAYGTDIPNPASIFC